MSELPKSTWLGVNGVSVQVCLVPKDMYGFMPLPGASAEQWPQWSVNNGATPIFTTIKLQDGVWLSPVQPKSHRKPTTCDYSLLMGPSINTSPEI